MVLANYKLLTEHLNVNHLRLVMERLWAECNLGFGDTYPDFMDAIMPLASLPVEIAGRNRMQRELVAKLLKWILNGKRVHCTTKSRSVWSNWSINVYGEVHWQWQKSAPTREEAEEMLDKLVESTYLLWMLMI
jgi:homoserine O-acetyltransferase